MKRPVAWLGVSMVCASAIGACGGSSTKSPGASATTSSSPTSVSAPGGSVPPSTAAGTASAITRTACSFVTREQAQKVLGAPTTNTGTETDYAPAYKTCSWTANGPAGGNSNQMRLGVIRLNAGQQPFAAKKAGLTATAVSGVGDNATFSSTPTTTGFSEALLVANQGRVSVSIDVNYGGSIVRPPTVQALLSDIAKSVFTEVGA